MRILAGDIGGTKTALALYDVDGHGATTAPPRPAVERKYPSREYPSLAAILETFLRETGAQPERACFGVAGPVITNRTEATNLPWVIDGAALGARFGLGLTTLVNDFVAAAYGVLNITDADLAVVHPGRRAPSGPIAVLGAGTGLGEAYLHAANGRYSVLPSEGGHADFAPRDEVQIGLLRWLIARKGRVSYERVISGLGLRNIYEYLRESGVAPEAPELRAALDRGEDLGALVGTHALAGTDPLCVATLDLFVSAYGAEAGNMALRGVATGGVFLAGGIATKVLPAMTDGRFRAAYLDKGRLSDLVASIPVYVITHPNVGLLGAAACALVQG